MLRHFLHYGIHFGLPFLIAFLFYRKQYWRASIILLLGIVIDLDHFLSNPIFDPNRCSIGYHPLHTYWAIAIYTILFIIPKTRLIGIALLVHIFADTVDCSFIN